MFIPATTPQSPLNILKQAMQLYFSNFNALLPVIVALMLVSYLPNLLIPELNSNKIEVLQQGMQFFFMYMPVYLLVIVILHAVIIGRLQALSEQAHDETINTAAHHALRKALPLFVATLLYSFFISVGFMLMVLPGIFVAVTLAFYIPCILFEKQTGIKSLTMSHRLVSGHWWHTAATLLIALLFFLSLSSLTGQMLVSVLTFIGMDVSPLTAQFIYIICTSFINPVFHAVVLLQYRDLKIRHGHDITNSLRSNTFVA